MSDPTISDNRGCVWFCFGKNRHCAYCDIMGTCNATACPYAVWVADAGGMEVGK